MSSNKTNYWQGVVSRLFSLSKTVFDFAAPVAVNIGVDVLIGKACEKIETRLKKMYIKTARNSGITFLINLIGCIFLILRPFGKSLSLIISFSCFFGATVFFIVRLIIWIKENGSQTIELMKSIVKMQSIHKGIEQYVLSSFPLISLAYAGIEIGETYLPVLKQIPRIPELIDTLTKIFWKRLVLFAGIISIYTVTVFWILKPILLKKYI